MPCNRLAANRKATDPDVVRIIGGAGSSLPPGPKAIARLSGRLPVHFGMMRRLFDFLYLAVAIISAPIWVVRMARTGKIRTDWAGRLGRIAALPPKKTQRILFHAVSVGELNAIRMLVDRLAASSERLEIVIATTTDTGFARARELWSARFPVVRYPFDFSVSVNRFLKAVDPDAVALVELEVWPNFTAACAKHRIPVCVINGRLTERSFRRYLRVRSLIAPSFRRLSKVGVQNEAYAARFRALGVLPIHIQITGTMKWDAAQIADHVPGSGELARELGIDRARPLIVAGSTAPGEHELLLSAKPPHAQLLCAPRKPEWFDEAALALPGCVRRSNAATVRHGADLFLLDTIGELRKAYALADLVVIGRSFGDLYGSDMIEPIALGKPTVVGPAVADFQDVMEILLRHGGVVQTTPGQLANVIATLLLQDSARSAQLVERGRIAIRSQQGATERTFQLMLDCLHELPQASREGLTKPNPPSRLAAVTAVEEKEERL